MDALKRGGTGGQNDTLERVASIGVGRDTPTSSQQSEGCLSVVGERSFTFPKPIGTVFFQNKRASRLGATDPFVFPCFTLLPVSKGSSQESSQNFVWF